MTTSNLKTIEALEAFLEGDQLAAFAVLGNKTNATILPIKHWLNLAI